MAPRSSHARKSKILRCKWCGKRLDSKKHHNITESYCFVLHEEEIRSRARPRVRTLNDIYDGNGAIRSEFVETDVERMLMKRQQTKAIDAALTFGGLNGYQPPRSLEYILEQGFVLSQVTRRDPWGVLVIHEGRRRMLRRNNLWAAIEVHRKLKRRYKYVYLISLRRSYDIPQAWRFKKDSLKKKIKWCPRCVDFRIFRKVEPASTFYALKKVWSNDKNRYEWTDRKVWLVECIVCGCTNKDPVYRRSNQPWEVRKIKKGVSRVKRAPGLPKKRKGKRVRQ